MAENSFFKNIGKEIYIITKLITPNTYNIISGKYAGRDGDYILVENAELKEIENGKEKSKQKLGNIAVNKSVISMISFA
ncbi:MAG: hypothetical protein NC926_10325 [Candidatus Omnitrophica bacterium]|nr:hypothetical protein [Candidatus Omnitrophota bacterium]